MNPQMGGFASPLGGGAQNALAQAMQRRNINLPASAVSSVSQTPVPQSPQGQAPAQPQAPMGAQGGSMNSMGNIISPDNINLVIKALTGYLGSHAKIQEAQQIPQDNNDVKKKSLSPSPMGL